MRGKVLVAVQSQTDGGITPAYAGKRLRSLRSAPARGDHPRLCGEKLSWQYDPGSDRRITPAYAGKSVSEMSLASTYTDHPRLCGEKGTANTRSETKEGSPPPMRGKDYTPPLTRSTLRDHPRLCGEKLSRLGMGLGKTGSPPPMRGKDNLCRKTVQRTRITPAYAGKRRTIQGVRDQIEDHPRLCGEKLLLCEHCGKPIGSPPPMRGKDSVALFVFCFVRITPAYAGKSFWLII